MGFDGFLDESSFRPNVLVPQKDPLLVWGHDGNEVNEKEHHDSQARQFNDHVLHRPVEDEGNWDPSQVDEDWHHRHKEPKAHTPSCLLPGRVEEEETWDGVKSQDGDGDDKENLTYLGVGQ